ncbi:MAG: serine hydrolase, partial [Bacteroidota bacterium]
LFAIFFLAFCLPQTGYAQAIDPRDYHGAWEAKLDARTFTQRVTLAREAGNKWRVRMANSQLFFDKVVTNTGSDEIKLALGEGLDFRGTLAADGTELVGFLTSMDTRYRLTLKRNEAGQYVGEWKSFYFSELQPAKLYLSVYVWRGSRFEAYPVLGDDRYRGTYAVEFQQEGTAVSFLDRRAGYRFAGQLRGDTIELDLFLGGERVTHTPLKFFRSTEEWTRGTSAISRVARPQSPPERHDGWETGTVTEVGQNTALLDRLVDSIEADALVNLHCVLIAHRGKLVYENYFNGWHADLLQDQRSAAKSIASALVGVALKEGVLGDVDDPLYDYLPEEYQATKDARKARITLEHLLTMRSGLEITTPNGNEGLAGEDYYQETDQWLSTVLRAPMAHEPGSYCQYGSANPFLLGVALASQLSEPLDDYLHDRIFGPLGITDYSLPVDTDGRPYFGGGTYLRPRDMLKFGEMYRQGGVWRGRRVIPEAWVEQSWTKHTRLQNGAGNPYGYQFWHQDYPVGKRTYAAVEARGAGGQYISVIPELELTLVITSGNYRNGRYWQPRHIIERYLLPVFGGE